MKASSVFSSPAERAVAGACAAAVRAASGTNVADAITVRRVTLKELSSGMAVPYCIAFVLSMKRKECSTYEHQKQAKREKAKTTSQTGERAEQAGSEFQHASGSRAGASRDADDPLGFHPLDSFCR